MTIKIITSSVNFAFINHKCLAPIYLKKLTETYNSIDTNIIGNNEELNIDYLIN